MYPVLLPSSLFLKKMRALMIEYSLAAQVWWRSEYYFLWAVSPTIYPKPYITDHKAIMKCLARQLYIWLFLKCDLAEASQIMCNSYVKT